MTRPQLTQSASANADAAAGCHVSNTVRVSTGYPVLVPYEPEQAQNTWVMAQVAPPQPLLPVRFPRRPRGETSSIASMSWISSPSPATSSSCLPASPAMATPEAPRLAGPLRWVPTGAGEAGFWGDAGTVGDRNVQRFRVRDLLDVSDYCCFRGDRDRGLRPAGLVREDRPPDFSRSLLLLELKDLLRQHSIDPSEALLGDLIRWQVRSAQRMAGQAMTS